jgi:exodeoxyribonuclease VII small subunit
MAKNEPKPIDAMTYEETIAELEMIVAALESGERPLEESMSLFERGQALSKHGVKLLDTAELKVQALVGESLADFKEDQ